MWLLTLHYVTCVNELKPNTKDQQDYTTCQGTKMEMGRKSIVGLPRTRDGYDSIWVIVDRLTKVAHFIPVKTTYSGAQLAELYMSRIVCLHGVPKKIVSDRGTQLTSRFWKRLHESMDTKLNFSLAYHPQTDGQTERTNQVLEDMLRACALKHGRS
jgi:IS30 family transposase